MSVSHFKISPCNLERRLRQHNGYITGGAKYTSAKKGDGNWQYYGKVIDLEHNQALSIEKRIQKKHRKVKGKTPLERRLNAIEIILKDYDNITFEKMI